MLSAFSMGTAAFLLYAFTGARSIQWQDSAQFTYRICSGTLWNEYGLAMVHPFHFWVGRLMLWIFPGSDPWAVSLVSAAGGGLAVGLLFACVHSLTGKKSSALFGAVTLMFAHSFWRFSGLPEVYSWSAALLLAEIFFYLRLRHTDHFSAWWAVFFFNGLAFANHNMALLSLAVWGITFLLGCGSEKKRWLHLPVLGVFWLLGAFPYILIILLELQHRSADAVFHSALFGEGFKDQVTGLLPQPGILLISLGFMLLSFPGFALPLAAWAALKRKKFSVPLPLLFITALHLGFFLRYNVIDQYTFLIPVYALIALMAGLGFAELKPGRWRRLAWGLLCLQPLFYAAVPGVARESGVLSKHERHKPYRDDYHYLFTPWQFRERSAERLMRDAFDAVGSEGILVLEDSMVVYTVKWMRLHLGLEDQVNITRPAEWMSAPPPVGSVWIPARSDLPPLEGWEKRGEVWVKQAEPERHLPAMPQLVPEESQQ